MDNRFLPLIPGTQFVLEGTANVDGQSVARRVRTTVTDLTKVINGVRTVVLLDKDLNDGELAEHELAFHAQDKDGNVWNLGEYPEEYDKGKFIGAPNTWIAGVDGAKAGTAMLGHPQVGGPTYLQGFAPDIDFLDCASVIKTGQRVCVPVRCFNDVLVTDEFSPLDPAGGHQRKFHAPGVGIVEVTAVEDPEGETLELVKLKRLDSDEMAHAREVALKLERRGYLFSEVYQQTPPLQRARSDDAVGVE